MTKSMQYQQLERGLRLREVFEKEMAKLQDLGERLCVHEFNGITVQLTAHDKTLHEVNEGTFEKRLFGAIMGQKMEDVPEPCWSYQVQYLTEQDALRILEILASAKRRRLNELANDIEQLLPKLNAAT